jgi:hypothetical protein
MEPDVLSAALLALVPVAVSLRMRLLDWMIERWGGARTFAGHAVFYAVVIAVFTSLA